MRLIINMPEDIQNDLLFCRVLRNILVFVVVLHCAPTEWRGKSASSCSDSVYAIHVQDDKIHSNNNNNSKKLSTEYEATDFSFPYLMNSKAFYLITFVC